MVTTLSTLLILLVSFNLVSTVSTDKSTAASEDLMKTAEWQKNTLNLNADIWSFVNGEYPTLK